MYYIRRMLKLFFNSSCPRCRYHFNDWFITNGISTPYGSGGEWARYCYPYWFRKQVLIKEDNNQPLNMD